jgi:hypothetical protein
VWWDRTTDLFVYIDRSAALLRSASGYWPQRRVRDVARIARGQLAQGLGEAARDAGGARRRLHVLLGSSLCRFLLLDNTQDLKSDAEVPALATGLLQDRLGLDPAEWTCKADRDWDRAALVCAIRSSLLDELRASATAAQCALVSVRPWIGELIRSGDHRIRAFEMLGVIEPDSVSLVSGASESNRVQTLPLSDGDPREALRYLGDSAAVPAQALPIARFESPGAGPEAQRVRSDFSDCAKLRLNPS